MRRLRELENALLRVESVVAVVLVLVMLTLAAYNVVYRNVLIPLQQHWAHSGPPLEPPAEPGAPPGSAPASTEDPEPPRPDPVRGGDDLEGFGGGLSDEPGDRDNKQPAGAGGGDDFGGFGGGLDEDEGEGEDEGEAEDEDEDEDGAPASSRGLALKGQVAGAEGKAPAASDDRSSDDFGGFGGGLGDDPPKAEPAGGDDFGGFGGGLGDDPPKVEPAGGDDFGGFGGGLGADQSASDGADERVSATPDPKVDEPEQDDFGEDDFGEDDLGDDDQFANLPDIDAAGQQAPTSEGPVAGPPPEGSLAAWAVGFIDDIKLDWIDVLLRQLVIIVSFLGAMLATRRRKHINIDALSKVLPDSLRRVVSVLTPLFALAICLVLAGAGWDLVQISRQFPKELLPFADEWHLQLMFPVGFGLLALHFGLQAVEVVMMPPLDDDEPRPSTVVTLVDEEHEPEVEAAGLVSKHVADISEASGELRPPGTSGGDSSRDSDESGGPS
ncbi:MAG: TRAP transporter small permease [Myxococcota bacterium]